MDIRDLGFISRHNGVRTSLAADRMRCGQELGFCSVYTSNNDAGVDSV